jgi:hypothetical protein
MSHNRSLEARLCPVIDILLPVTWSKEPSSQIKRKETKGGMAAEPSQPVKKKIMGSLSFGQTKNKIRHWTAQDLFLFVGRLNSSPIAKHCLVYSSYGAFTLDVKSVLKRKSRWHPRWHPMLNV